ncbi:hypothetical protein D3C84_871480 [compost metagenome]
METPLDLGEVLTFFGTEIPKYGIDILLRRHNHPSAATTSSTKILGDGLQFEHHLGVVADELAHFID